MPSGSGQRGGFGQSNPSLFDAEEPFAHEGAMPAGFSRSETNQAGGGYGGGAAAVNPFDDDDGPGAYAFSASADNAAYAGRYKRSRWQRFKEDRLSDIDWTFGVNSLLGRKSKFDGVPREIMINDPEGNRVKGYEKNSVSTAKYGPLTFLPKFLISEFSRSANLFFLFTGGLRTVYLKADAPQPVSNKYQTSRPPAVIRPLFLCLSS